MATGNRVLVLLLAAACVACAPTKQARSVERSGFLGDLYPLMKKGGDGEALLIYKSSRVADIPRGTYTKMLLEPVTIWAPPGQRDEQRVRDEQHLADMLYSLTYENLAPDYEMVTEPGPNTLRIQSAITSATRSYVVLRAVSTIPAPMNAFAVGSLVKDLVTGKPLFVGDVSLEMKVLDAETGEVLGASADRRVGKRHLDSHSLDSWDDVHQALKYWAQKVRWRFCKERGEANCPFARMVSFGLFTES